MTKQEVESFIQECAAIKKMLRYLTPDIIESQVLDIDLEIQMLDKIELSKEEKENLQDNLETYKKIFEDEVRLRIT